MVRHLTARFVAVALIAVTVQLLVGTAAGQQPATKAAVPVVVIDGRGFGHGVGMAQEGAFWMGSAGSTTEQILQQFYPGTGIGRAGGPVRVPVLDAGGAPSSATLLFPKGGEVRESAPTGAAGFPVRVRPGEQVRIDWDGSTYRVESSNSVSNASSADVVALGPTRMISTYRQVPTLPPPPSDPPTTQPTTTTSPASTTSTPPGSRPSVQTTTTAPSSPTTTAMPGSPGTTTGRSGPVSRASLVGLPVEGGTIALPARGREYRGVIEATASSGALRLVNALDVEQYLKGMGEVLDPKWPQAALKAQAIAARTYALRAMAFGGEICETQRCQVYLGAQAEYAQMNKAVDTTRAQVLVFNKSLASAVYSANGGGFSASREEGFGVLETDAPYLRPAPYPTKDPHGWSVTVALTDVGARLGYNGVPTDVRISRVGPSGRALEVVLDGPSGPKAVTGLAFDAALGLKSTLISLRLDTGDAPPPPAPTDETLTQAPPEEAAAVAVSEVAGAPKLKSRDRIARQQAESSKTNEPTELLIVASWLVLAALGALVVWLSPQTQNATMPTREPSPSAPRTEDGSR